MKRILLVLFFFSVVSAFSQTPNITIKGKAANADGKEIELYKYSDQLSRTEVLLDNSIIGASGFELKMYAKYTTLVFLQVENYTQSFYVEPGRTYEVLIPKFDWSIDERRNIHLSPEALPVVFENLPKDEVNLKINALDAFVDSFISVNRYYFDQKFRPQRRYFDTLALLVDKKFPDGKNAFFNRYKKFSLAELKYKLSFDSRKNMYNKYIANQPPLYYDENYMTLFFTVFANSISGGNRYNNIHKLSRWINNGNMGTYMDSIGLDPLLRNEQIRELVAIQALKESYYKTKVYKQDKVVAALENLRSKTKFPEHRELIRNLLSMFSQKSKGGDVATFTLPDVDKKMVSLDSFKGKWIYLSFVRVGEPHSLKEIETLAYFKDSIYSRSKNVEFVTICCDREFQKMYHFLRNNKKGSRYNWTWLHFNNNFKLLERYSVVSFPTFLLINPDGKLQYSVTPSPGSGLLVNPPWVEKKEAEKKGFFLNGGR
ncbi:MAG: TlpA family protein disulfide reductase [Bacteroidales bacterium]|nr:TlpA family protein disulfide reductase [Bacteroidales bacterium]